MLLMEIEDKMFHKYNDCPMCGNKLLIINESKKDINKLKIIECSHCAYIFRPEQKLKYYTLWAAEIMSFRESKGTQYYRIIIREENKTTITITHTSKLLGKRRTIIIPFVIKWNKMTKLSSLVSLLKKIELLQ